MITNEQKVEMFKMRIAGVTYEAIGEKFGVTKQGVYNALSYIVKGTGRSMARCIYPAISDWCAEHGESLYSLSKMTGINTTLLYAKVEGKKDFKQSEIDKILAITSLTYESAFAQEEKPHE